MKQNNCEKWLSSPFQTSTEENWQRLNWKMKIQRNPPFVLLQQHHTGKQFRTEHHVDHLLVVRLLHADVPQQGRKSDCVAYLHHCDEWLKHFCSYLNDEDLLLSSWSFRFFSQNNPVQVHGWYYYSVVTCSCILYQAWMHSCIAGRAFASQNQDGELANLPRRRASSRPKSRQDLQCTWTLEVFNTDPVLWPQSLFALYCTLKNSQAWRQNEDNIQQKYNEENNEHEYPGWQIHESKCPCPFSQQHDWWVELCRL